MLRKRAGKSRSLWLILGCLSLFVASTAWGGAYYFPQLGARAASMGNAFAAVADDASTVFHNPAGMTQIDEAVGNYSVGIMFPNFTYTREANGQTYDKEVQELKVMSAFLLGYVSPSRKSDVTSGFVLYSGWGGLPKWRKDAPSRYVLKHNFLITTHANYSVAYPVLEGLSVAGGLSLVYGYNQQNKSLDFQDLAGAEAEEDYWNEMDILMTGDGFSWGYNLACLYKPFDEFSLALTYTSEVRFDMDMEMKSTTPFILSALMPTMVMDAEVTLILPQNVRLGSAYQISDRLKTSFDVIWVNWDVVKDTNVNFKEGDFFIKGRDYIAIPRNWQDSFTFSIGFEFQSYLWNDTVFRGGYSFDQWAIPESTMMIDNPDADKHIFSFGGSYVYSDKMILDLGIDLRFYEDRHVTNSVYAGDDPAVVGGVANGTYEEFIFALFIGARMTD